MSDLNLPSTPNKPYKLFTNKTITNKYTNDIPMERDGEHTTIADADVVTMHSNWVIPADSEAYSSSSGYIWNEFGDYAPLFLMALRRYVAGRLAYDTSQYMTVSTADLPAWFVWFMENIMGEQSTSLSLTTTNTTIQPELAKLRMQAKAWYACYLLTNDLKDYAGNMRTKTHDYKELYELIPLISPPDVITLEQFEDFYKNPSGYVVSASEFIRQMSDVLKANEEKYTALLSRFGWTVEDLETIDSEVVDGSETNTNASTSNDKVTTTRTSTNNRITSEASEEIDSNTVSRGETGTSSTTGTKSSDQESDTEKTATGTNTTTGSKTIDQETDGTKTNTGTASTSGSSTGSTSANSVGNMASSSSADKTQDNKKSAYNGSGMLDDTQVSESTNGANTESSTSASSGASSASNTTNESKSEASSEVSSSINNESNESIDSKTERGVESASVSVTEDSAGTESHTLTGSESGSNTRTGSNTGTAMETGSESVSDTANGNVASTAAGTHTEIRRRVRSWKETDAEISAATAWNVLEQLIFDDIIRAGCSGFYA